MVWVVMPFRFMSLAWFMIPCSSSGIASVVSGFPAVFVLGGKLAFVGSFFVCVGFFYSRFLFYGCSCVNKRTAIIIIISMHIVSRFAVSVVFSVSM